MANFEPLPSAIGLQGIPEAVKGLLVAIKNNVDLLTGQRGANNAKSAAVLKETITITGVPDVKLVQSSATGAGFVISNVKVASQVDHEQLVSDFKQHLEDFKAQVIILDLLIKQLRGER